MENILIIAVLTPSLPRVADELSSVSNDTGGYIIASQIVSESSISEAVRSRKFDGIWFIGESDDSGLDLGAGSKLSASALAAFANACGASWIFLNSCKSESLVRDIQKHAPNIDVIAVDASLPGVKDIDAWRMGSLLADAYRESGDIEKAYYSVMPHGVDVYRYYRGSYRPMDNQKGPVDLSRVENKIAVLDAKVDVLWAVYIGEKSRYPISTAVTFTSGTIAVLTFLWLFYMTMIR